MKFSGDNACRIFAITCASLACVIGTAVITLWHRAPAQLMGFDPGRPVMIPNAALGIGVAGVTLLFLSYGPSLLRMRAATLAAGVLLAGMGFSALIEFSLSQRMWVNHGYFDMLAMHATKVSFTDVPCPVSGTLFALLGIAFALWTLNFRLAQLFLFITVALGAAILLGHVYDVPFLYRFTAHNPLAGTSALTASSVALLCTGMLFSRSKESVVRISLAGGPAGAVLARFGLGAIAFLAITGPLTSLRAPMSATHLFALREMLTVVMFVGVTALVWSSVRVLERLERERKEALSSLEESRERLLYAQRMARLGYWHWNMVNDRVHASENLLRILGLPGNESTPLPYEEFTRCVHPDDRRVLREALYSCIAGHSFFKVGFRVIRPGGELLYIHSQAHIELDENGLPWRMRGTCHDVTETKLAEERAEKLLSQANEAVRVREDVLSIVSHDLKNPLASASLGIQLLVRQLKIRPEEAGIYRTALTVQRSLDNMKNLIQNLLDIGKLESGTFSVCTEPLEINELLFALDAVMQPIARDRGVELTVELSNLPTKIQGDRSRLLQVLFNLVGNALKFTPRGKEVLVRSEHDGSTQVFSVEDNGPGIPECELPNVFRRNWQARATAAAGNGLGLFIAKGIVESHNGKIWLETEEGRGCRFRFSIPEVEANQLAASVGQSPPWNEIPAIV
jgi:signal transduction histidine kinase